MIKSLHRILPDGRLKIIYNMKTFTLTEIREAEKRYLMALKAIWGEKDPEDCIEIWDTVVGCAKYFFPDFSEFLKNEEEWIRKEKIYSEEK